MKKTLLLFIFSLFFSLGVFAQGTIQVTFNICPIKSTFGYDPAYNTTQDGTTWNGYTSGSALRVKYNASLNRWQIEDISGNGTPYSYCPNTTGPKPPTTGWVDSFGCGVATLTGDVSVISLSPSTLPNATSGTAYSQAITASGGTGPYSFELLSGSLPMGLTLSNGGVLSGTPTAAGTYNFRIKATDASSEYSHQAYTLIVTAPEINVQGNSTTIADGDNTPSTADHTDFGSTPVASGSIVRTFTIQNTGAGSLSISSVMVSGTNAADFSITAQPSTTVAASSFTTFEVTFNPSAVGVSNATVTVNSNDSDEAAYDFAVTGVGTDLIVSTTQNNVRCNGEANGSATVSPSGATGTVTYSWSPSGGNAATASNLAAGTYTVTVIDDNETETVDVTITQPDELFLPHGIHNGNLGEPYSFPASRATLGGTSPYSYQLAGGALPPGLSLSTAGNITGTPTSAGTFSFTIRVTDSKGCLIFTSFYLEINKRSQTISFPALASGIKYGDGPITLNASANSGLTVSYASSNPAVATISGQTLTIVGVGTANITASQPGNAEWFAAADKAQTITVGKKNLTVTATGSNKVYDGNTAASITLSDDRVSGDDLTTAYTTASFDSKNVGPGKAVSVSGISISGMDAGNYTFNSTAATTADITAKTLTVTAVGVNKAYDGNNTATVTLNDDRASGDELSTTYTTASFDSKNVGTNKAVDVSGISISGADVGNYTLSNTTASTTANITAKTLMVTAVGNNKAYDGSKTATVSLSDDRVSGDVLTTAYTNAAFENKNVATNKVMSVTGISISGPDAANYNLSNTSASTTADITAKTLTVTAVGNNKTYDGSKTATVTLNNDRVSGDVLTTAYTTASFDNKNVGTNKAVGVSGISISGPDAANYNLSNTSASTTANITAKTLMVTATGINKVYDGNNTATVALNDDRVGGDALITAYTNATFDNKNVGTNKAVSVTGVSIGGADAANYNLSNTSASTTANITAKTLTVTASGNNKTYDGSKTATVSLNDDRVSSDVLTTAYTNAAFNNKNVGTNKAVSVTGISISGTDAVNYSVKTTASTAADITAKTLTVTADAGQSKPYGATDPVFTYTATGFANGESTSILSGALSRAAGEAVGTYFIQIGTLNAGSNYTINFTGADFSIISTDTDGDGVPDDVEEDQGTKPNDPADYKDTDKDGVPDYVETQQGSNPNDAKDYKDADGDGVPDYVETQQGTDPNDKNDYLDTDKDGIPDYVEQQGTQATITALNINGKEFIEPGELVHYTIDCTNNTNTVAVSLATSAGASSDSGSQFTIQTPNPGIYRKTITVSSLNGAETKAYQLVVEKMFQSEQIIEQKFNNVLLVNNNFNNNGGYTFVNYQWYKDGQKIGNGQYYSAGDAVTDRLDPNATYNLALTTDAGDVLHVCGFAVELDLQSNILYPNPVTPGSVITVQTGFNADELEEANINIYSLTGILLQQIQATETKTTLTIPDSLTPGIYLVVYKTATYKKTFKLVVK